MIIHLKVGLIKKTVQKRKYFPEPKYLRGRVKVELNLTKYTTKAVLKNEIGVNISKFVKKFHLAILKSNVNK